ncbi:MAG: sigma-70 family RNA polymerase sigma factor [Bryobacteraceae bacterium]
MQNRRDEDLALLARHAAAEDEVQNAYWKAYQHFGQFHCDAKFSTWITRIVINQCLMRPREQRPASLIYLGDPGGDDRRVMELADERRTPEENLGSKEVQALLAREVSRIPPLLRNAFVLRDVKELSMQQAAAELGISVAAAKSRLLRARTELRQRLEKHYRRLGPFTRLARG